MCVLKSLSEPVFFQIHHVVEFYNAISYPCNFERALKGMFTVLCNHKGRHYQSLVRNCLGLGAYCPAHSLFVLFHHLCNYGFRWNLVKGSSMNLAPALAKTTMILRHLVTGIPLPTPTSVLVETLTKVRIQKSIQKVPDEQQAFQVLSQRLSLSYVTSHSQNVEEPGDQFLRQ